MQDGKNPKINKRAGWNFAKVTTMKTIFDRNFPKIDTRVRWNKGVQVGFFQKIDKCAASLLDRLE